jgi:RNA-directed DNA polymerase
MKNKTYYSLFDRLLHRRALAQAFANVRRARGAPGIDGQSIDDFASKEQGEIDRLLHELRTRNYGPMPVKRVSIPKPGGGHRNLGIPAVRDRIVQQALLDILQPIFDPQFHPSSYGYRPGRSCQDAVAKATMFIRRYHLEHVVDMDLSKCFDRLDHDFVITSLKKRVRDGSILTLVRKFLESGVMIEGRREGTEIGSPQGGVISPLIANIYLDAFDQEMKRRGHRIVRYADDILILSRSRKAAENACRVATEILGKVLHLKVNTEKTHLVHPSQGVKFLGVEIGMWRTSIQDKKIEAFKLKVKALSRRNSPVNLEKIIHDLNPVMRGVGYYFRMANCKGKYMELSAWIRRRLRAKQLALWKRPSRLHRRLRQMGYGGDFAKIRMRSWRNSRSPQASYAMPNDWFRELGLFEMEKLKTGVLPEIK